MDFQSQSISQSNTSIQNNTDTLTYLNNIQQDTTNTEHAKSFQLIKSFESKTMSDCRNHSTGHKCCLVSSEQYISNITKNYIIKNEEYFNIAAIVSTNFTHKIMQVNICIFYRLYNWVIIFYFYSLYFFIFM